MTRTLNTRYAVPATPSFWGQQVEQVTVSIWIGILAGIGIIGGFLAFLI